MSDISLSKAVRSNLLSLQNTATMMAKTQERLATGNKVNSALDNPTNYFTASALNSRAGDISQLLDGMNNGIQTLQAADNGLKAITKTLESMQSTLRQARQDKSFQTQSYTVDPAAIGTSALKSLTFAGGSIGSTPVSIDLNTVAVATSATTLTGAGANFSTALTGGSLSINGTNVPIRGDQTLQATTLAGTGADFATNFTGGDLLINGEAVTVRGDQAAVASTTTSVGGATLATDKGGKIIISGPSAWELEVDLADGLTLEQVAAAINAEYQTQESSTAEIAAINSAGQLVLTNAVGADAFTVADDSTNTNGTTAALGLTTGTATSDNGAAFDADITSVLDDLANSGITGLTATNINGQISLSLASGADITITGGTLATALGFGTGNLVSTNGTEAFDATAATVAEDINTANIAGLSANGTSGQLALSLSTGAELAIATSTLATALGFGPDNLSSDNGVVGSAGAVKTIDALVDEINKNADLKGNIRASNDNGKLRIENLSTQKLDITGAGDKGIDGAATALSAIEGNSVRSDLAAQFRDLRDQLDKLADDASFNGINLLRGDNLQITFNEIATSEVNIRSKDEQGISSTVLKLDNNLQASDLDSDANIDKLIAGVKTAINSVRSQSSAFGASLSVVQNRQDFSKNMINTLQTGAANLTLADMNEEAANLLALQTRQSLSSSALSMASQADQSVLQLLR
jgi:flagellin